MEDLEKRITGDWIELREKSGDFCALLDALSVPGYQLRAAADALRLKPRHPLFSALVVLSRLPDTEDLLDIMVKIEIYRSSYHSLERGIITVVADRVGAGKTTLLRALLGLLPADIGTISWNGNVVPSQVQRVAAARMFVSGAELLVMDDLSSALDIETERRLWERLLLRGSGTCLVVSHRPWLLERADRILLLSDGRIVDAGRLDELLARSPEMASLLRPGRA